MDVQSIKCGLPFCGPQDNQTKCSRNLRITTVALAIILLLIGVGTLVGAFPLGTTIGWTYTSLGIVALALGSSLRYIKKSENANDNAIKPDPVDQQKISLNSKASIQQKKEINFDETFTSGKISFISARQVGKNISLVESVEGNEICTLAAFSIAFEKTAIKTWVTYRESVMRPYQVIAFNTNPYNFKFYKDTLLVSFEDYVRVLTVGQGQIPTVTESPNYFQPYFEYKAHLLDLNANYLAISTEESIFVVSKEDQTKYKLSSTDQLVLNGDYLIGFSKIENKLKIWDLKNKKKCLEINNLNIGEIKKLGNGFIYSINIEESYSKDYYIWYPDDDNSRLIKSLDSPIFATFDRYIAVVTHSNQIEIFDENFNSLRTIQLEDNSHITDIQFLGTHIAYQSRIGKLTGNSIILEEEASYVVAAFNPVFSKD